MIGPITRSRLICAAAALAVCCGARAAEGNRGVLLMDSERLSLLSGGSLEYPCIAEIELRTVPADATGLVRLSLKGNRALEGRMAPALLSSTEVMLDKGGQHLLLVSGDSPGWLELQAEWKGTTLSKKLEVCPRWRREPIVITPLPRPELSLSPEISRRAEQAVRELYDPRDSIRTAARKTLISLGRASIRPLLDAVTDPQAPWDVRSLAVRTLSGIRDENSVLSLSLALRHSSAFVRYAAASGLRGTEDEAVIQAVREALEDDDPVVRSAALEVAVSVPSLKGSAVSLLSDPDPLVRGRTAWELASSNDPFLQSLLDNQGQGLFDPATFVRVCALRGLVAGGSSRLFAGVVAALAHTEGHVRAQGVLAAAPVWNDRLTALALGDNDPYVQRALAYSSANIFPLDTALVFLRKLFDAGDNEARRIARRTLAAKGAFEDIDRMVSLLDEVEFREDAIAALRRITSLDFGYPAAGNQETRDRALREWKEWWRQHRNGGPCEIWRGAMKQENSRLRGRAAHLLVLSGEPPDTIRLEALTLDKYPENRIEAAAALFRTGRIKKATDVLLDEARSENWRARRLAIQTAADLEHPGAFAVLVAGMDDPEPSLRRAAWDALSTLSNAGLVFHPYAPPAQRQAAIHRIQEWYKKAHPEYYAETR